MCMYISSSAIPEHPGQYIWFFTLSQLFAIVRLEEGGLVYINFYSDYIIIM